MNSASLKKTFASFRDVTALVIGDVMLDAYWSGSVSRISPEAPVPVVDISSKEQRPGGAANVARNLRELGATTVLCSVTGDDAGGRTLRDLLAGYGIGGEGMVFSPDRITTVKSRVIGNNHQMIRVDEETTGDISPAEERALLARIGEAISGKRVGVIVIEDYDKGAVTPALVKAVTALARSAGIPMAVDPKKRNFLNYRGAALFKPNLRELKEGLNSDVDASDAGALNALVESFRLRQDHRAVLLTLSGHGAMICSGEGCHRVPARVRNVADVSGAGDTVISVAALCLALGLPEKDIAVLANLAGGQVCGRVGVVAVDGEQLLQEAIGCYASGKS